MTSPLAMLDTLQTTLGYRFIQPRLLEEAVAHPGLPHHNSRRAFERLEFLGDRVLGLSIATHLYQHFEQEAEGELARRLAQLCSRNFLAEVGKRWQLERAITTHKLEPTLNIYADMVEAILGAIYTDGEFTSVHSIIGIFWRDALQIAQPPLDAKSRLQYWLQSCGLPLPQYKTLTQSGPDHLPVFQVQVTATGQSSIGYGKSKKEAERNAAQNLYEQLTRTP